MSDELVQLELFAQVDELVRRLRQWSDGESRWDSLNHSRAVIRRLLTRLESLRVRLEAPLVVATFGGTGTGKSALVNALAGQECSRSGRERPTTTRPVLICHHTAELDPLHLPLERFDVVRSSAAVLRDVVILDCPDPDTNETDTAGSNLEILRQMLPLCDVLIYTSTQQKYRSARVIDELDTAASGCRLIFVQTHADHDSDIRDDWRKQLSGRFEVPELYFIDSIRALREQQSGQRPTGDFARLQDLLTTRLAATQRLKIRRANLVDLAQAAVVRCQSGLDAHAESLDRIDTALAEHRLRLARQMSDQLRSQLEGCRHLWEQRVLSNVTQRWGASPFSALLRLYNGLGGLLASASLLRARTGAQMVLVGAMQGSRWLSARQRDRDAEDRFEEVAALGVDEAMLREMQIVLTGYLHDARLDPALARPTSSGTLQQQASRVHARFLESARQRIDGVIEDLAKRNSGFMARTWYELLLISFIGFVLYRAGRNFFVDTFIDPNTPVLTVDYYISAAIFFALWSTLLVLSFCRRLRRGMNRAITNLADELAGQKLRGSLFPELEDTLQSITAERERLAAIVATCSQLKHELATSGDLGSPRELNAEPITI